MKQENYIKGMIMIILSAFFFACMNVSVRLAGNLPSVEKSFFRNLVAAVFAAVILCKDHTLPKVNKKYWGPLILRCVCGTMGILCNFYAIDHLLVADASILNKLSPFFAIIFSFLFFMFVCDSVDGISFHTNDGETVCNTYDGRIICGRRTVYDHSGIHVCTCGKNFHF